MLAGTLGSGVSPLLGSRVPTPLEVAFRLEGHHWKALRDTKKNRNRDKHYPPKWDLNRGLRWRRWRVVVKKNTMETVGVGECKTIRQEGT
jgi:hypothetical protein